MAIDRPSWVDDCEPLDAKETAKIRRAISLVGEEERIATQQVVDVMLQAEFLGSLPPDVDEEEISDLRDEMATAVNQLVFTDDLHFPLTWNLETYAPAADTTWVRAEGATQEDTDAGLRGLEALKAAVDRDADLLLHPKRARTSRPARRPTKGSEHE